MWAAADAAKTGADSVELSRSGLDGGCREVVVRYAELILQGDAEVGIQVEEGVSGEIISVSPKNPVQQGVD